MLNLPEVKAALVLVYLFPKWVCRKRVLLMKKTEMMVLEKVKKYKRRIIFRILATVLRLSSESDRIICCLSSESSRFDLGVAGSRS